MSNTLKNFILVMAPISIGIVAQILLKTGMLQIGKFSVEISKLFMTFVGIFLNPFVLVGMFLYFAASLLWLIVLSRIDLSFAYPLLSIGYIFIVLYSDIVLKEEVSLVRWAGVLTICLGVFLISRS
jgi:drug/metabolite transporter (DMT)-like permease